MPDGQPVWQTDIGCEPATIAPSDSRLFVACSESGELIVLNDHSGEILARTWVGHGPFGVLVNSDRVYVTLANANTLLALDADTLAETGRASTSHQPRGLALKGSRLYVVHLLDAAVEVFNAQTLTPIAKIRIGQQGALAEGLTLHPERQRAYVPHQRQNVSKLEGLFDSTVLPVLTALDTQQFRPVIPETLALDSVDTPVGMPAATVLSPDGMQLYVVNAASDDISVIDLAQGIGIGHVVVGYHPRDLALSPDGDRLYTLNLVSDDISVVDIATLTVVQTLTLAEDPQPAIIQQGERIFFTSRPEEIALDNWIACASCHFDGGFDGRTWAGAEGGPRNTPILRGINGTEPLHWSADRPNVQSFQETFVGLMAGTGLSQSDLDALAAYLNGLEPFSSPLRKVDGSLADDAAQGAAIFQQAGCAVCHSPPLFTDRQMHDVGTGEPFHYALDLTVNDLGKVPETMGSSFDTPSLRELWLTAPYLHDGRALTLRDMLTAFNQDGQHGETAGLSEPELAALEAFLMALPLTSDELADLFGE